MMVGGKVKVSVIIPVYNAAEYLGQCLDSVICQTLDDIEIICIDDGSQDDSVLMLNEYRKKDDRIIIFAQENLGAGPARNLGIRQASGMFIAFMDADDYYPDSGVLKLLYEKATENDALICGGSMSIISEDRVISGRHSLSSFIKEGWINFSDFQWDYGFYRYLYEKEFIIRNRIVFPDLRRYQDPPFLLHAMTCAKRFYAIKEMVYCYRSKRENYDSWSFAKVNDLAKGILMNAAMARKNDLNVVLKNNIQRVNEDYCRLFVMSAEKGNDELIRYLNRIGEIAKEYQIRPLKILEGTADQKRSTGEYLNNIAICLKENGLKYTINRILFHLHLKDDNDPQRTDSKWQNNSHQ